MIEYDEMSQSWLEDSKANLEFANLRILKNGINTSDSKDEKTAD